MHRWIVSCFALLLVLLACNLPFQAQPTPAPTGPDHQPTSEQTGATETQEPDPTDAPVPTEFALPGWERFEGGGIELWLPESFEGGDLGQDLDIILESLQTLGPEFESIGEMVEQNPEAFALWIFDTDVAPGGALTNVNVTTEKVLSAFTLDTYVDLVVDQYPENFTVLERTPVSLGDLDASQLVIGADLNGTLLKVLQYIVLEDGRVWAIVYSTGLAEFDTRLPVFEQSAQTFRILP